MPDPTPKAPTVAQLDHDVRETQDLVRELLDAQNSAGSRVWDIVTKLALALSVGVWGWVWSLSMEVAKHHTALQTVEATRFTAQDGLRLEARMLDRHQPQMALLLSEMRQMSVDMTTRLTRLETQMTALQKQAGDK